jgi:ABC-type transport system substrate-binding protein
MVHPEPGEAPCGQAEAPDTSHSAYTGNLKKISATDAKTVIFELCQPDVAFLAKVASPAFAIQDTAWLESRIDPDLDASQAIVSEVNGTGPFRLEAWNHGSDISMARNDAYRAEKASPERLVVRWNDSAAQRLVELQSATVDGIDDVAPTDYELVEGNADLALKQREGMNVSYIGMNNTYAPFDNDRVRRAIAMGIDRRRLVEDLLPAGSEVASHFTPCAIPNGCTGDPWYEFDPAAAKQLLADAGYPDGFKTTIHYRDVVRTYLPDPMKVAEALQAQLKANLGIDAEIEAHPADAFLDDADAGRLDGLHLLGWGIDLPVGTKYPDVSHFLDFHFGTGATSQFGTKWDDVTSALAAGASVADQAAREPSYVAANNAIRSHVPMIPIAHVGSAAAYRADVTEAHGSPMGIENFAVVTPGDRRQFVWMQSAEPAGLYCADETDPATLRICAQMTESLYAHDVGGADVVPGLAQGCEPNAELTIWTCTLRMGVTFHDGAVLDSNDVVLTFASQWDAEHPLHKGRDHAFTNFAGAFGGFLHPPPSTPEG